MDPPGKKKRCFVISPIGSEGSEIREHADEVFDFIIRPALLACNIEPIRSDHITEPGKISESMFSEIQKDDLCVAVLTGFNPNVFYELAIAQASCRPVIILLEKGNDLPFDIHDLRCVYYDLKLRSYHDKIYIDQIVHYIKGLEQISWKVKPPWGESISSQFPFKLFAKSADFGNPDHWMSILKGTEKNFDIMGISLVSWREHHDFVDSLLTKARNGCKVRILIIHQDNPCLPQLFNIESMKTPEEISREIKDMFTFYSGIFDKNIQVRQILRGCPHYQIARSDNLLVTIPYLYSRNPALSPLIECTPDSSLYTALSNEFQSLWKANESLT
jgi:hypothetical protein